MIWKDEDGVGIPVGAFLTALIAFLILAAVVYFFVVTPYTKAKEKFFPSPSEEPAGTPEDIALLTEIRDALVARNAGGAGAGGDHSPTPDPARTPTPRAPPAPATHARGRPPRA